MCYPRMPCKLKKECGYCFIVGVEKIPSKVVSGSGDPLMQWGLVDKANKLKKPKIDLTDDKNANWIKSLAERDQ